MLAQIQALDTQIDKLSEQINEIKNGFENPDIPVTEEVCLDEAEGNKAALEAMKNFCLAAMLDLDPQGEA